MVDQESVAFALSSFGTVLALGLFSSQIPMFRAIARAGSAAGYTVAPTVFLAGNCLSWTLVAIYVQHRPELALVNGIGVCFTAAYAFMFVRFTHDRAARRSLLLRFCTLYVGILALFAVLFVLPSGIPVATADTVSRGVAVFFNVLLFAGPIQSVRYALRTLDASRVPSLLTVVSLVSCVNWGAFGLVIEDVSVAAPNWIGFVLSGGQLAALLYVRHRLRNGAVPAFELKAAVGTAAATATAAPVAGDPSATLSPAAVGVHGCAFAVATAPAEAEWDAAAMAAAGAAALAVASPAEAQLAAAFHRRIEASAAESAVQDCAVGMPASSPALPWAAALDGVRVASALDVAAGTSALASASASRASLDTLRGPDGDFDAGSEVQLSVGRMSAPVPPMPAASGGRPPRAPAHASAATAASAQPEAWQWSGSVGLTLADDDAAAPAAAGTRALVSPSRVCVQSADWSAALMLAAPAGGAPDGAGAEQRQPRSAHAAQPSCDKTAFSPLPAVAWPGSPGGALSAAAGATASPAAQAVPPLHA